MDAEQWTRAFGPFDGTGSPIEVDDLATTEAIRCRPARRTPSSRSRAPSGESTAIEASAFPIVASEAGTSGAMVLFWPVAEEGGE